MGIVQRRPDAVAAHIMNAINAYAERTGCVLLAEGIEDDSHFAAALALGAQLGQGWKFGRPLPVPAAARRSAIRMVDPHVIGSGPALATPFDLLPAGVALRTSTKPLLIEVSKHLERQALGLGPGGIVIGAFQRAQHFTPATAGRYRTLAQRIGFVAAIGEGLSDEPAAGVRGASLGDDPLRQEWDIVVLSPYFAAALIARDLEDDGPENQRRFEFFLTYDRGLVTAAAESLISRIAPSAVVAEPA